MKGFQEAPGATIGVIERYREYLPVTEATPVVSLSEGSTPLIYSPRLSALVGRGCQVYLKHEGSNPTGSFKDRGMTVAVSKAAESGARLVDLRFYRKHVRGRCGLCSAGWHSMRRAVAIRKNRDG